MYVVWMIIGGVLALIVQQSIFAFVIGAAIGLLWARQSALSRQLVALRVQREHADADAELPFPPARAPQTQVSVESPPVATRRQPVTARMPDDIAAMAMHAPADISVDTSASDETESAVAAAMPPLPPDAPAPPSLPERLAQRAWGWLTEGNVPVKIGMLVIFVGVAAGLKYASDSGLLRVPIGVRMSLIAVAAIVGLMLGWRQRSRRQVFALSLQGGAIGVLLLTVFAAFHLYALLPASAAFGLMVVLVAGIGVLAVLQDALALAVLGLIAGFAAPILVSSGDGNHVVLFSYYALLNAAILGIAWRRAWRMLNLLGFIATFAIGTGWGVLRYEPTLFASTEPFLVLNFLFYLVIPWLYLRHPGSGRQRIMDGGLLFGNPLVSLLLQGALLNWDSHLLALSTLMTAAIYVAAAFSFRRYMDMSVLRDGWTILALIFATLTVPLACGAQLTGSVLALEGAGMVWLGLRQQRAWSRWGGLALQLFAAGALVSGRMLHVSRPALPVVNGEFVSMLFVVLGGFATSALYARRGAVTLAPRLLAVAAYLWGMLWWLLACATEQARFGSLHTLVPVWLALLAFTAWAVAEVTRRRPGHELEKCLAFSVPVLLAVMLPLLLGGLIRGQQPLAGWSLAAVVVAAAFGWRTLACLRSHEAPAGLSQLAWFWRWGLLFASAISIALSSTGASDSWQALLSLLPWFALYSVSLRRPALMAPPLPQLIAQWRRPWLYSLFVIWVAGGVWALLHGGDAEPLPYLPLLNPTDLLLLGIAAVLASWLADADTPASLRRLRPTILGLFVMLFATSATLRAVHQLGGVPWDGAELGGSSLAQMSLTLIWSALGLLAWVWGSRRGQRPLWIAGAVVMAIVLLKLLLIDRGHLGNLFGIGSFIAYGLLCTLIGYLAPAPPKETVHAS